MKCSYVIIISLVNLLALIPTSVSFALWVNAAIEKDYVGCGLNAAAPCKTLNYTLARSLEIAQNMDTLQVLLQTSIHGEEVIFQDNNHTFSRITFQAEDNTTRALIAHSNITIIASVELFNMHIDSSRLFVWHLRIVDSLISHSIVHNLTLEQDNEPIASKTIILSSRFVDTTGILEDVHIRGSTFLSSPLHIMLVCEVYASTFYNSSSMPALVVQSCFINGSTFEHNTANRGSAITSYGLLQVRSSTLKYNTAREGGAIYAEGYLSIINCTISENYARIGGGIYIIGGVEDITLLSCFNSIIESNAAAEGGGIAIIGGMLISFPSCILVGNQANERGGGLYIRDSTLSGGGTWVIAGNSAYEGGGVYANASSLELSGEAVSNEGDKGSALYATNSVVLLSSIEFRSSAGSVVHLQNSSSSLPSWTNTIFKGSSYFQDSLVCDDCADMLCAADTNCLDCPYGCLEFGSSLVCITHDVHHTRFGCYGASTCAYVKSNMPVCHCPIGFHGTLCSIPDSNQPESFPKYAIALIVVAASVVIVIVFAAVWYYRKNHYKYKAIP